MKKLLFLSLAVGVVGLACSQAEKHPNMLGDCDVCTPDLGGGTVGGGDSGTTDASADDSGDASAADVEPADAISLDGTNE